MSWSVSIPPVQLVIQVKPDKGKHEFVADKICGDSKS